MNKKYLIPLLTTLFLVGCNGGTNPQGTTSTPNNPTTPTQGNYTSWTEEEKAIMMDAIGTILPEGPFSNERQSEGYIDEYDGAYTFYMFDGACGDVSAQYASILENAGWIDDGTDDSYGYLIYYYYLPVEDSETDFIYIQLDYYPGDDEYEPGIDLYAWIYSSDSSEGGDWMYTSWPEADINTLFEGLTAIPAVPGTGFDLYDYEGQIIVMAETNSDIENTYCDILEDAGWTVDLSYYDEYGIIATSAANDIELCFYYDSYSEWFIMSIAAI